MQKRVSEVDLMSDRYPSRIERQWDECMKSLKLFGGEILLATERTLGRAFSNDDSLIPVPIRIGANQQRRERYPSHD
jgi:hypothetical protein